MDVELLEKDQYKFDLTFKDHTMRDICEAFIEDYTIAARECDVEPTEEEYMSFEDFIQAMFERKLDGEQITLEQLEELGKLEGRR